MISVAWRTHDLHPTARISKLNSVSNQVVEHLFKLLLVERHPVQFRRDFRADLDLFLLRNRAREMGMRTLREDGARKVIAGLTTADEVIRNTVSDEG